ncbi:uncharacterized protein LOC128204651 [Mya arenaria]|uniref:uncharacterized protein LOC128204651 n=1 Tax=Mya arenaria TaxID=6604 RepID=UPI0022DFD363|nr:uncharacterized protein LOC128204651 [Mya arenaria]
MTELKALIPKSSDIDVLTCDDGSDFKETTECPEDNEDQPQIEDVDIEATEDIENLDDDFNRIIASIISIDAEAIEFEIPEQFNITTVIENMKYEKEKSSTGVPEACLAKYYRLSHEFTTSADYTLSCIDLFGDECSFSDHHRIVCYNIVEAIRLFYLKQKVDLLKITKGNIPKRQVTDASRARIRYVAGYCLASLRKKYTKIQHSNLYSKTKEGQDIYSEAKCTVSILNTLKEEEHYLKANTNEPESLLDVERRQYSSRGLTNVTDSLFNFFVKLTEECMAVFVHENLMTFGKSMYNMCLDHIKQNQSLYPLFISVVVNSCSMAGVVEFDEDQDINSILEKMVLISSQTCSIFNELIQKYLMVLLSQFRKDFKSSLRVEKTMAHRKQIKVSKQSKDKSKVSETIPSKRQKVAKTRTKTGSIHTNEPHIGPIEESQPCPLNEPQPGPSKEPQPGPSTEPQPGPSKEPQPDHTHETISDDTDLCQKCFSEREEEWIQCDSCNSWFHRQCAGLKNQRLWKKFIKDEISWFCNCCK